MSLDAGDKDDEARWLFTAQDTAARRQDVRWEVSNGTGGTDRRIAHRSPLGLIV
jgi:hypothetical protein